MPVRSPHPTRGARASQALRRADEVRRVHHRHEAKHQDRSVQRHVAPEESHGHSVGLVRGLRAAAGGHTPQAAASKSPGGACSLANVAKAFAFGVLLYFAFHGVANHAAGAGFDVSAGVFGAHVSRVDDGSLNARDPGDHHSAQQQPVQPALPASINGSVSVKPNRNQESSNLVRLPQDNNKKSSSPLANNAKATKVLPRIEWQEPPPSFAAVALLEMFRMCAFEGASADAWDPSQSFVFHGKQQRDSEAGDGVDAAALTPRPKEGQQLLGYVSLQGAPLELYGLPQDLLLKRATATGAAADLNSRLPLASAALSVDPRGRFDLLLRALVAAGISPRSGNLDLHHWAS